MNFCTLMINGSTTVLNHGASYFAPGRYYLEIYSSKYDDGEGFLRPGLQVPPETRH